MAGEIENFERRRFDSSTLVPHKKHEHVSS